MNIVERQFIDIDDVPSGTRVYVYKTIQDSYYYFGMLMKPAILVKSDKCWEDKTKCSFCTLLDKYKYIEIVIESRTKVCLKAHKLLMTENGKFILIERRSEIECNE